MSRLSGQSGILNISQPYRPPRPLMGIALNFLSFFKYWPSFLQVVSLCITICVVSHSSLREMILKMKFNCPKHVDRIWLMENIILFSYWSWHPSDCIASRCRRRRRSGREGGGNSLITSLNSLRSNPVKCCYLIHTWNIYFREELLVTSVHWKR
jgi:hypothetical protein